MQEGLALEFGIPEVRLPTFLAFLKYLYYDDLDLDADASTELLALAHRVRHPCP